MLDVLADKITYSAPPLVLSAQLLGCGVGYFGVEMRCCKCKEDLDVSEFHRNKKSKTGRQSQCKDCRVLLANGKEYAKNYRYLNAKAIQKRTREWKANNPEKCRASSVKWRSKNQTKIKAHKCISRAIKRGLLSSQPCHICDSPMALAHHEDYSKPYEVIWLCHTHHHERHMELKELGIKL